MLDSETSPVHQLFEDLKGVKLARVNRVKVTQARVAYEAHGSLPTSVVVNLRGIHRRHSQQIHKLYEARERARNSMARRRMGLSDGEVKLRQEERRDVLRRRVEDLGF